MQIAASAALLFLVLGVTGGAWHPWSPTIPAIIPAGRFPIVIGLLLATFATARSLIIHRRVPSSLEMSNPVVWAVGLIIIFFSDWLLRPWGFFPDPFVRGQLLILAGVFAWMLSTRWSSLVAVWLALSIGALCWSFAIMSGGAPLLSDDHAMFLFRLKLLKANFPNIPFWSPMWNAGFDARDFFATGALNAFLLASPLVYLVDIEQGYNSIIALLLWVLVPGSLYLSCRLLGGTRSAACVAAILSLASSLIWYRWALKYGTIGFVTSAALYPLCVVLWLRFLESRRPAWRLCIGLAVLSTLMFLWSPSAIALGPVALVALPMVLRLLCSPRHLLTAALVVCLNLPWVAVMWRVSNVGGFLNAEGSGAQAVQPMEQPSASATEASATAPPQEFRHKAGSFNPRRAMKELHVQMTAMNPLIVVFGVPAVLSVMLGIRRITFALLATWLLFLGTFGVSLKPQLELDRMGLFAGLLLIAPVGIYLSRLFESSLQSRWRRAAAIVTGSFLLASPFAASSVVLNQSSERYRFGHHDMQALTKVLAEHVQDGRGLFTGCVVHEMNGAHVAPMALWANKPLIASSYSHNLWWYKQPIPASFLSRGDQGIREYLDLMNVTVVLAHEPTWISFLNSHRDEFREIFHTEKFFVYERISFQPSFAQEGTLTNLSITTNSVTFTPGTERLVLKFNYFPFLTSSQCTIRPLQIAPDISFIELSGCLPGTPTTIRSVSPYERIFRSGDNT